MHNPFTTVEEHGYNMEMIYRKQEKERVMREDAQDYSVPSDDDGGDDE